MPFLTPPARRNRAILLAAAVLSVIAGWIVAVALSTPVPRPDGLTRVLRGMVSIKGAIFAGAVGLAFWRMGRAINLRPTVGYIAAMALSGFAVGVLWSLSFLGVGSGLFWFGLLVALWGVSRDREMLQGWAAG